MRGLHICLVYSTTYAFFGLVDDGHSHSLPWISSVNNLLCNRFEASLRG